MLNNIPNKQDVVVIGGGTSGVMFALGALQCGLKVTLISEHADLSNSSLMSEVIPTKALAYCAMLANTIKNANNFGLDVRLAPINLTKINNYIAKTVKELQTDNDLDTFERLGGTLLIGSAKFLNHQDILVNDIRISSKYFIIATGTKEPKLSIVDGNQSDFLTYRQIFQKTTVMKKTIIIGNRPECLEVAQALARFGSQVTIVCSKPKILPLEDTGLTSKLLAVLEQEGVDIYLSTTVLQFYWQNQRKLLVCQDKQGDKFAIDSDEIINMQDPQANIDGLDLRHAGVHYSKDGILVNSKLQTSKKNIFALGSVIKSPFKSVHLMEHQTNVILSNIAFKIPKKIDYKLVPRVLFTYPQLAAVGLTITNNAKKVLQFDFKNIDSAIYQQQTAGGVKIIYQDNKLLGASLLGAMAAELITEYSFAMQVGADISEIAGNMHAYPTFSQINKRVAHKIFTVQKNTARVTIEKAIHKMHQVFAKLSFAN